MPTRQVLVFNEKTMQFEDRTPVRRYSDDVHMVMPDTAGYISPVTQKWVEGRHQRREDLKRSGCREVDPSEKKDFMDQSFKANVDIGLDDEELTHSLSMVWENQDNPEWLRNFQRGGKRDVYEVY